MKITFEIEGRTYGISNDADNWILLEEKVNSKTGERRWERVAFFARAWHMADRLARLGAPGVADDLIAAVQKVENAIKAAIPGKPGDEK